MRASPGTPAKAVKIEPQQYEKYLKRAYQQAKFTKPRNLIGIPKDLPKTEMEQLMLTNIQISEDELMELANERAQAAKDFITRDDQVTVAKVFLLAPKVQAPRGGGKLAGTRVDFSLN